MAGDPYSGEALRDEGDEDSSEDRQRGIEPPVLARNAQGHGARGVARGENDLSAEGPGGVVETVDVESEGLGPFSDILYVSGRIGDYANASFTRDRADHLLVCQSDLW